MNITERLSDSYEAVMGKYFGYVHKFSMYVSDVVTKKGFILQYDGTHRGIGVYSIFTVKGYEYTAGCVGISGVYFIVKYDDGILYKIGNFLINKIKLNIGLRITMECIKSIVIGTSIFVYVLLIILMFVLSIFLIGRIYS